MSLRTAWLVVAACVLLAAGARSQGKDVTVSDDDQTTIVDCNAGTATVSGDDNKVTIKGDCRALTVSGDDNVITAATVNELSVSGDDNTLTVDNVARINVSGDDNSITWKLGVGGKRPEISDQGDDNKIREAKVARSDASTSEPSPLLARRGAAHIKRYCQATKECAAGWWIKVRQKESLEQPPRLREGVGFAAFFLIAQPPLLARRGQPL